MAGRRSAHADKQLVGFPQAQATSDPELSLADRIRRYQQAQIALERARELIKYMPVEVNVVTENAATTHQP